FPPLVQLAQNRLWCGVVILADCSLLSLNCTHPGLQQQHTTPFPDKPHSGLPSKAMSWSWGFNLPPIRSPSSLRSPWPWVSFVSFTLSSTHSPSHICTAGECCSLCPQRTAVWTRLPLPRRSWSWSSIPLAPQPRLAAHCSTTGPTS